MEFEWDLSKDRINQAKHNISFTAAQRAFFDPGRVIALDTEHSGQELRYYCFGKVDDDDVVTVRFTLRGAKIRIIGAGYWRKGKKAYDEKNS